MRTDRTRLLSVVGITVLIGGGAAYGIGRAGGESGGAAAAGPPKNTTTVAVKRTDLVETADHDGTLGYAGTRDVTANVTGVVTGLPAVGARITRGRTLFRVNDRPVTLFYGSVPLYRTLASGVTDGTDVAQLERNLAALGHDPSGMTADHHWTAATTAAVNDWKADRGLTEDGTITAADVQFAAGPVRVGALKTTKGRKVAAGTALFAATDTAREVTVPLEAPDAAKAKVRDKVTIRLPDGSSVGGRVTSVSTTATAPSTDDASATSTTSTSTTPATVDVTVAVDAPEKVGALSTAPVTVAFTRQRAKGVLAVPVTALLMLAGGGHAVQVDEGGGRSRLVAVKSGLYSADGLVEVSGTGVTEGTRVIVPTSS